MRLKIPPHMRKFKVMKHKRIKHNSDEVIIPLVPLQALERLNRGVTVRNKKRYIRRNKKQEIKTLIERIDE
jgi:hypothetical protein